MKDYLDLTTICNENRLQGQKIMVFDWEKAAELITEYNIMNAEAFIRNDEITTCGKIIDNGRLVADHDAILESYQNKPTLRNMDNGEEWECFKYRCTTNWTASAVLLLTGGEMP